MHEHMHHTHTHTQAHSLQAAACMLTWLPWPGSPDPKGGALSPMFPHPGSLQLDFTQPSWC